MSYNTLNSTETMNTQQLQQEIIKTQYKLKKLQEQLEATKSFNIKTAPIGKTLPMGTVIERYNNCVIVAAPESTVVRCTWSQGFKPVFDSLKNYGFIPSQWYIPTKEELQLAYRNCRDQFSSTCYWSSTKMSSVKAYRITTYNGNAFGDDMNSYWWARAFRRVVF